MYLKKKDNAHIVRTKRLPYAFELDAEALGKYSDELEEITKEEYDAIVDEEARINRVTALKKLLSDSDYIACKIAEGAATREEYTEIIAQRQSWREEINQLESGGGV